MTEELETLDDFSRSNRYEIYNLYWLSFLVVLTFP